MTFTANYTKSTLKRTYAGKPIKKYLRIMEQIGQVIEAKEKDVINKIWKIKYKIL
jgi:hypothetical protein